MLKQNFDIKTLKGCLRKKDFGVHRLRYQNDAMLDEALADMCREANRDDYLIQSIRSYTIKNKPAYSIETLADNLVARRINKIIKRVYKVRQADRTVIIKQLTALISESTPYSIIRTDIKDFYESVNPMTVLNKIESDGIISSKICKILNALYTQDSNYDGNGLRRGLGISATLSEIKMRKFDKAVKAEPGVFYYARYVDDIIVFTITDPRQTLKAIKGYLSDELKLNANKTSITYVPCRKKIESFDDRFSCEDVDSCSGKIKSINFLGYKLEFSCHKKNKMKPKKVHVKIAQKKVKKILTRISRAFIDYSHTGDYQQLKKRVQFLTGNYRLNSTTRSSYLMSGIHYNYPLLTKPYLDLKLLDSYLRNIIYAETNSFSPGLNLSSTQQSELKKYSFQHGHEHRLSKSFSASDIEEINRCWKYE